MHIPRPCDESWDGMEGGDAARRCERCDETVHDVASLSASEVLGFVEEKGGACLRLSRTPDGTVRTRSSKPRRRLRVLGAAAGVALGGAAAWVAETWPAIPLLFPDRVAPPYEEHVLVGFLLELEEPEPHVWSPGSEDLSDRSGSWRPSPEAADALVSEARSKTRRLYELFGGSMNGPDIHAEETGLDPSGSEEPE